MTKTVGQLLAKGDVRSAIINTKNVLPEYWKELLHQRLKSANGGYYPQFDQDIEKLDERIFKANWEETQHGAIERGCRIFITQLPGVLGVISIEDAPDEAVFMASDFQNHGVAFLITRDPRIVREYVNTTYLITSLSKGYEVVYDFHPGEPIRPTMVRDPSITHGVCMTRARALACGFKWARWWGK